MRYVGLLAGIGLLLAVTGTAGATDVTWTIDITHNTSALDGTCTPYTGYLYDGGIFSGYTQGVPGVHNLTADGVPTNQLGQLHGKVESTSYVDLSMRLVGNDWWPHLPTNANASHTFDVPYITSATTSQTTIWPELGGTVTYTAQLSDDWGDTYLGNGYLEILGRDTITQAEIDSGLWDAWRVIDGQWVDVAAARYPLVYNSTANTYSKAQDWNDFAWSLGTYDLGLTLSRTGASIEEISVREYAQVDLVPEPVTMAGLMLGIGCLARYVRKRRTL